MDKAARLELGRRIKAKMDAEDISREDVLEGLAQLGITVSLKTISNIRQGRHPGEVATLLGIAEVLGLDTEKTDAAAAGTGDLDESTLAAEYDRVSQEYLLAKSRVVGLRAQLTTLRTHLESEANQVLDEWSLDPRARTTREFTDHVIAAFLEKRAAQGDDEPEIAAALVRSAMAQVALKEQAEASGNTGPALIRPRITSRSQIKQEAAIAHARAVVQRVDPGGLAEFDRQFLAPAELTEAELDDDEGLLYDDSLDQPQVQPLRRGLPGGSAPLADAARTTNKEPGLTKRRREHDEAAERIEDDPTGWEPI